MTTSRAIESHVSAESAPARAVLLVGAQAWRALDVAVASLGFDVVRCSGPQPPGYTCTFVSRYAQGDCTVPCPLAVRTAGVVVDCRLASDHAEAGTPGWMHAAYYRSLGLPVVVLGDDFTYPHGVRAEGIVVVPPTSGARAAARALRAAVEGDVLSE